MSNPVTRYRNARSMVRCGATYESAADAHSVDQAVLACLVDGERRIRKGAKVVIVCADYPRTVFEVVRRHGNNIQVKHPVNGVFWTPVADCELAD